MRRVRILVLILLAGAAAVAVFTRQRNRDVVDVVVETVRREPRLRSIVAASGEIVAARYADIGSSVMGKIVALMVAEGSRVRAGEVLARIDPVQARADLAAATALAEAQQAEAAAAARQVEAARADLALAEARQHEAELTHARREELFASALVPREELDAARAALDSARAQVEASRAALARAEEALEAARRRVVQARAQADRARDLLQKTEVTAPIDGLVTRLDVREGEMVVIGIQNQPGTRLMTISDLSRINAEVKVAEADVLRLRPGQPATVQLEATPGRRFSGRVVEIGASAVPVTSAAAAREFRVVIRLDEADAALRPGLTCDAEILVEEKTGVLAAPLQAVVVRDVGRAESGGPGGSDESRERPGVFVVDGDRVRFQPVSVGIIGGLLLEIEGIGEGTPIVTGPFQALRDLADGARIRARRLPAAR
jgi:HlyD family secretion protein